MAKTGTERVRRTKQERLKERANKYVPQALKALENVANLAKLEPTTEQRTKILAVLTTQFEALTEAFSVTEPKADKAGFEL
jgi:dTDP-4-amino-4,6-dideoxygalactose transaminase